MIANQLVIKNLNFEFEFECCIKETKIPSQAKRLNIVRLKPRQSVISSNKQKSKCITSLWNILNRRQSVTF